MKRRQGTICAAVLGLGLCGAGIAQEAGVSEPAPGMDLPQRVIVRLDEGQARLLAGQVAWAGRLFDEANALTYGVAGLDPLIQHRPNLYQARYYKEIGDWRNLELFAGSVASALDAEGTRDHPFRIEAQFLLAHALAFQGRFTEAEPLFRSAVDGSSAYPVLLRGVFEEALFGLAETVSVIGGDEAFELRDLAINSWYEGHAVPVTKRNYFEYLQYLEARAQGIAAADVLPFVRDFIARIDATPQTPDWDRWLYYDVFGMLLTDAGEYAEAVPILEARLRYLVDAQTRGEELFWAVDHLAAARAGADGYAAALEVLDRWLPQAGAYDAPDWQVGYLYEAAGHYREQDGDTAGAQEAYRTAYLWLRKSAPKSDESVLRVAARIDPEDPALAAFELRHEVAGDRFPEFRLTARGTDVLRMFFEGGWRGVERHLAALREAGRGESVLFHVNEALFLALSGEYDAAMTALDTARETSRRSLDFAVRPNAPVFDLIDAVAKLWATGHEIEAARDPLDRLLARPDDLTDGEWSAALALDAYLAFRSGDEAGVEDAVWRWFDFYEPDHVATEWDIFAGLLAVEAAFWAVGEEDALWLMRELDNDLGQHPTLDLAKSLLELSYFEGSQTAFLGEGAVIEIGGIAQQLATDLPPTHRATVRAEHLMAATLSWHGRNGEALDWLVRAGDRLRADPYRAPDELAGLLSEQANVLISLARFNNAAVLAREAFDSVDPLTGDPAVAAQVLDALARALSARQGTNDEAVAFLGRQIDDAGFFDRLALADRVALLTTYGGLLAGVGSLDEVRDTIRRAEALIGAHTSGWEADRAELAWIRAEAEAQSGDSGRAFAAMRLSNDIYFDWAEGVLAAGGGDAAVSLDTHERALWEAELAWDYAQTLPE